MDDVYAVGAHIGHGGIDIAGLEVDAPASILHQIGLEAQLLGVEGGELDAIIGGQPQHKHAPDALGLEPVAHAGSAAVAIVEEAAVAVDVGVGAFGEHAGDAAGVECAYKFGTKTILNAMDGPQHLRKPVEVDDLSGLAPGVVGGEAAVGGGVPVLGGHDAAKVRHERVGDGHDEVAFIDGQCAQGAKIVLQIHED